MKTKKERTVRLVRNYKQNFAIFFIFIIVLVVLIIFTIHPFISITSVSDQEYDALNTLAQTITRDKQVIQPYNKNFNEYNIKILDDDTISVQVTTNNSRLKMVLSPDYEVISENISNFVVLNIIIYVGFALVFSISVATFLLTLLYATKTKTLARIR